VRTHVEAIAEPVGLAVEISGVAIIAGGIALFTLICAQRTLRGGATTDVAAVYRTFRRGVGPTILLGLEFLVAGDIIRTVAVRPTLRELAVLAGIVVIRTFLSIALEVEIEGRWPWQPTGEHATGQRAPRA
jgi:uncharacterized membrane protein